MYTYEARYMRIKNPMQDQLKKSKPKQTEQKEKEKEEYMVEWHMTYEAFLGVASSSL